MSHRRHLALALLTALAGGRAGAQVYDLVPVPRAGDGPSPLKAQVRKVAWVGQSEDGDLAAGAIVTVEVDVHNADAARAFELQAPRLEARPALGGAPIVFESAVPGQDTGLGPDFGSLGATPVGALGPGQTRTVWRTYVTPDEEPRGVMRLVLLIPVAGQPLLEVAIADPVPGGPRWTSPDAPLGLYCMGGGAALFGTTEITALEPLGFAQRRAQGRWIYGLAESVGFVYQQALAGGPPARGISVMAQVTWQPWRWPIAPYVEGGAYFGLQSAPAAYGGDAEFLVLPRVGVGVLLSAGPRLGATGPLPFERPLSAQRRGGWRLGYARWFNLADRGGVGGVQLTWEIGTSP